MKDFLLKYLTLFMTGGLFYYFLEITVRHYSHVSMIICGGLAMVLCGGLNQTFRHMGLLWQMILSSIVITELEYITGYIVNIKMGLLVWDYSDMPFNLGGQICLPYSILWMILSPGIILLDDMIRHRLFGEKKVKYHII